MDVALSADGRYAVTANATADSVSLADVSEGKVLTETPVGKRPFAVTLSRDGKRALVSNQYSDSITVLAVAPPTLHAIATIPVGDEPRGVAFAADGKMAFVALSGDNALAVVDLARKQVVERVAVGTEPWHVGLTPDGKTLAVGNARSQDVSVMDVATRKVTYSVKLRGRNVRHLAVAPDGTWAYVPHISERGRPATRESIGEGWIIGSRLSRIPLTQTGPREAIALDPHGKAVGDVDGCALSPNGALIALTAGGTHELLLLRPPLPFIAYGGPGDVMEESLVKDAEHFRRVPLGGCPRGVAFAPDGKTVVVANYLSNALQVVDVISGSVVRTVPLGGPAQPSLARQGEAIFLDAQRSFNQWYACNSCHVEGNTNGGNFDTFNDGSFNTPKKTLSLRGVTQTGPWTWHGWKKDLRRVLHDSMINSMQGNIPSEADLDALMAYMATLDFKPNPHRNPDGSLPPAAKRGETLFTAKGCTTCHAAPNYTSEGVYVVGLEAPEDAFKGFNPPSLRGVYARSPYLHDGRARTLQEVLTKYHRPSQLTGKPDFTPEELPDVLAFLKSL